jgi:spore germination protein D
MKNRLHVIIAIGCLAFVVSCGSDQPQAAPTDYKEIKTMVIDILKTEDGRKAIGDANKHGDGEDVMRMRILETEQGKRLQLVVQDILSDPAYAHALKELMVDPKFAGDFAKAVNEENKNIHKALMKDPEYQQALIDVLKDPQFEHILLETMKSSQYRQQVMVIMKDSMQSPLFQTQMIQLMQKALEEQTKPKPDAKKGESGNGKQTGNESQSGDENGGKQKQRDSKEEMI